MVSSSIWLRKPTHGGEEDVVEEGLAAGGDGVGEAVGGGVGSDSGGEVGQGDVEGVALLGEVDQDAVADVVGEDNGHIRPR